jgi:hypothetical protein
MTTLQDLTPILLTKTREGKLQWEDGGSGSFLASVDDVTLKVEYDNVSREVDHRLRLLNDDGEVIEEFVPRRGTDKAGPLAELYDLARRRALKVDESLAKLERSLKTL